MAFYDSKVGKLFVAQYDLTNFVREVTPSFAREMRDVTVLGDSGRRQFPGIGDNKLSFAGLFDDGSAGSDVAVMSTLRGATSPTVISVFPGDTVLGNIGCASGDGWAKAPELKSRVGSMVEFESGEIDLGLCDRVKSLGPKLSVSVTTDGSSITDSASSSDGGKWVYHITAFSASGGNVRWQIELQDSANNTDFATVGSESVNITAVGAARRTFTGTLRQHVRLRVVRDATSGMLEFFASYERD